MTKNTFQAERKNPIYTKDFILILLFYIFAILAEQMECNVYPVFLRASGYSVSQTGVFSSVLNLIGCVCPVLIGGFLNSNRRRETAVLTGVVAEFLGGIGFLLLSLQGDLLPSGALFAVFLGLRVIQGVGYSIYILAALTLVMDRMSAEQVVSRTAAYYNGGSLAAATGPALGLGLADAMGYSGTFRIMLLFLFTAAALALARLIYGRRTEKALPAPEPEPEEAPASRHRLHLFEKAALLPSLFMLYYEVTLGCIFSFIMLFSQELSLANTGIFYIPYHACAIAIRSVMTRIIARFGKKRTLLVCLLLEIAGLLVMFRATGMASILFTGVLLGTGDGFCYCIINVAAITRAPESHRNTANATFLTFKGLGLAIGSILWGYVADLTGLRSIYLCAAVMMILGWVAMFFYLRRRGADD
ncbi:MAG: MFS transporter [Oscillospiraceae bacterium]|nr:MFS transporter [Oscillospiraceae bacterium]